MHGEKTRQLNQMESTEYKGSYGISWNRFQASRRTTLVTIYSECDSAWGHSPWYNRHGWLGVNDQWSIVGTLGCSDLWCQAPEGASLVGTLGCSDLWCQVPEGASLVGTLGYSAPWCQVPETNRRAELRFLRDLMMTDLELTSLQRYLNNCCWQFAMICWQLLITSR